MHKHNKHDKVQEFCTCLLHNCWFQNCLLMSTSTLFSVQNLVRRQVCGKGSCGSGYSAETVIGGVSLWLVDMHEDGCRDMCGYTLWRTQVNDLNYLILWNLSLHNHPAVRPSPLNLSVNAKRQHTYTGKYHVSIETVVWGPDCKSTNYQICNISYISLREPLVRYKDQ